MPAARIVRVRIAVMKSLIIFIVAVSAASAESKAEAELRAKLAASQAALEVAVREKATLAASFARLSVGSAAAAKSSQSAADGREVAAANAANAMITAESNAAIAQAAVVAAAVAAAVAKEQADQSQREISHGHMTLMLTQMFGFLIVVVTLLAKAWTDERKHQWEQAKTEEHQTKVLAKLDKVNDSADAAYKEANTVNLKLVDIGVKMRDDKPLSPGEKGAA